MRVTSRAGRRVAWGIVTALLVAIPGCGGERGPERAAVSGKVTVGGEPLESGSITFVPAQGTAGAPSGGIVTAGRYAIASDKGPAVGKHVVRIEGTRSTGKQTESPFEPGKTVAETVSVVPAKYNQNSRLEREVMPGDNVLDFDLDAK